MLLMHDGNCFADTVVYRARQVYLEQDYVSLAEACAVLVARSIQEGGSPGTAASAILDAAYASLEVIGEGDVADAVKALRDSYRQAVGGAVAVTAAKAIVASVA